MSHVTAQTESRWPHRLAVLLVCATFPLIWVGGLVTTYEAGMAVPDWPNTYGYNLFLYPWQTWLFGPWDLFIEHGHRLFAATVGLLTIALMVSVFRRDRRNWLRWLSVVALVAVCFQGALGGMRVLFDERELAKIHACIGPLFFGLTVALAVFTSRRWTDSTPREEHRQGAKLHWLTLFTTALAYLQIMLGARLRHASVQLAPGEFGDQVVWHVLIGIVLAMHGVLVFMHVWRNHRETSSLRRPATALLALLGCQLLLGASTWIFKYGWPIWFRGYAWSESFVINDESLHQTLITTAHVATGSLILATSLLVALRALRLVKGSPIMARQATFGRALA